MKLLFLIPLLFFASCSNPSTVIERKMQKMEMPFHLIVENQQEKAGKVDAIIESVFQKIDTVFNNWNPHSEISHINQLDAHKKHPISPELAELICLAKSIWTTSEGRFDPTIEPLQKAWKAALRNHTLLPENKRALLHSAVGMDTIHCENGWFWKEHSQTALDLGGIAKGYAVDLLVEQLQKAGFEHIYVEWGGEIRVFGGHPEKRPWRIGISGLQFFIEIDTGAVATSGDYFQNWTIDDKTYFHIIDPKKGLPLEITDSSIATACVLAPTCSLADGIATSLMLFRSPDEAYLWASTQEPIQCWLGTH